ncbi:MAG: ATP-grasp domain-containing protein [Cyanobacteria bacterium P01_D01_bin.156]
MRIFNHDITLSTHDHEAGNHLFSGRALALTRPKDKIQINPELVSEWTYIVDHYAQIGLSHCHNVIWSCSLNEINHHSEYEPSFYFFGDAVNSHQQHRQFFTQLNSRWCEVVEFINSKNNFIQLAEDLGVPVPKTRRFANLAAAKAASDIPFPCYVKPAVSDHGAGIARCVDQSALDNAFAQLDPNASLQIQAEVQASAFLNLQYRVTAEGVQPLLVSEQVLEGCVHRGNRYPSEHTPWEEIKPLANWLAEHGMQGIFAVDVAVVPTSNGVEYLAIECNPRFNGSSYPTLVAQRLEIPCWSSATYKTHLRSLRDIDLTDIAFNPYKGRGVILINWGKIKVGEISVLLAGSPVEQFALDQELKARLNGDFEVAASADASRELALQG